MPKNAGQHLNVASGMLNAVPEDSRTFHGHSWQTVAPPRCFWSSGTCNSCQNDSLGFILWCTSWCDRGLTVQAHCARPMPINWDLSVDFVTSPFVCSGPAPLFTLSNIKYLLAVDDFSTYTEIIQQRLAKCADIVAHLKSVFMTHGFLDRSQTMCSVLWFRRERPGIKARHTQLQVSAMQFLKKKQPTPRRYALCSLSSSEKPP